MINKLLIVGISCVIVCALTGFGQITQPADDAANLYLQAGKLIVANYDRNVMSPSASNLEYAGYPSYPPAWHRLEAEDFPANALARDLAHRARSNPRGDWPTLDLQKPDLRYLNECRALANELGDSAVYQHLQGNDAAAVETLLDTIALADSLDKAKKEYLVQLLVSVGIRALAMDRLNIVASNAVLTSDPANIKGLQVSVVRDLIGKLLDRPDAKTELDAVVQSEAAMATDPDMQTAAKLKETVQQILQKSIDHAIITGNRVNAECGMSAVGLACHLYKFDKGSWPSSIGDLPAYLPKIPLDPFGDGKQTIEYHLIKAGLPDGLDRPLTYSRADAKDGLFYRTDQPFYSYYRDDGSKLPNSERKHGGQFRDIAAWMPKPASAPATQPLIP